MISPRFLALLSLPLLASAHFELHFPVSRGDNDETQASFPCGGLDTSANRTAVSLTSIPVSVELGHTENLFQIVLAIGNDVGESFNTVILPTIQEFGPGEFCLGDIPLPDGLNITEGTNGTIQVITNSHDGGGLYNVSPFTESSKALGKTNLDLIKCADVTFTSTSPEQPSSCTNGTGISASPLVGDAYVFANDSASHGDHGDASSSGSASGTAASATGSASPTASSDSYANMLSVGWGLLGAAVLGAVALL